MSNITTIVSTMTAAFLGSFVEVVEAFTIILAVGVSRSWKPAFIGTGLALIVLAALVIILGPLLGLIPIELLQFVIGTLLILFGMRWLRKAILARFRRYCSSRRGRSLRQGDRSAQTPGGRTTRGLDRWNRRVQGGTA